MRYTEPDRVGEHMASVRQQRERIRDDATDNFDDKVRHDEREADRERPQVTGSSPR
jgi:hypothetical protein